MVFKTNQELLLLIPIIKISTKPVNLDTVGHILYCLLKQEM